MGLTWYISWNLHYTSFLLPLFNTDYQMDRKWNIGILWLDLNSISAFHFIMHSGIVFTLQKYVKIQIMTIFWEKKCTNRYTCLNINSVYMKSNNTTITCNMSPKVIFPASQLQAWSIIRMVPTADSSHPRPPPTPTQRWPLENTRFPAPLIHPSPCDSILSHQTLTIFSKSPFF